VGARAVSRARYLVPQNQKAALTRKHAADQEEATFMLYLSEINPMIRGEITSPRE
jgi:hypothetical protein